MNYPCSASIDELKNDPQVPPIEEYQKEQLIKTVTDELFQSYLEDHEFFLGALNEQEKETLVSEVVGLTMFPDPNDDLFEAHCKTSDYIKQKMYSTAKFLAEDKARDVWG